MDFQQQQKKQSIKEEFIRLNRWDEDADLTMKQQRLMTADSIVRQKEKQQPAYGKAIKSYDFEEVKVFGAAAGEPLQELTPAKKAKCRNRQDRQRENEAKKAVRKRSEEEGTETSLLQERVDGTSFRIHRSIEQGIVDLEGNMVLHRDAQDRPDYAAMKYFSGLSDHLVEDYRKDDYEERKKYLKWMTDGLMRENIRAEYFDPEFIAQSGGPLYTKIMRFKAFKDVYTDPLNKTYFDGLSSMEKQLIQIRILDMADLYENVLRFQCRCCGINMDNGQYLGSDAELAATPVELEAVHSFKERIERRNVQTRAVMASSYMAGLTNVEDTIEGLQQARRENIEHGEEQELQGSGLTGFLVGFAPNTMIEIRTLFTDNPEAYEANKPLLDMLEQEFFRVTDAGTEYTRKAKAIDEVRAEVDATGAYGTVAEKEFIKFIMSEADQLSLKQTALINRQNALRDAMKAIVKNRKPENKSSEKVIREFRQKLGSKGKALQAQLDAATAGWAERRLNEVDDEQWKAHERYDGTQELGTYIDYLTAQKQGQYTAQLDALGLGAMMREEVNSGRVKPLTHAVQTRAGAVKGLTVERMIGNMQVLTVISNMTVHQARDILTKLATGENGPEGTEEKDRITGEGLIEYKNVVYQYLKGMERKYGKLLTQLHPEDVMKRINFHEFGMEARMIQDMVNLIDDNETGIRLFDENNPADVEYKALAGYFFRAINAVIAYVQSHSHYKPNSEGMEQQAEFLTLRMAEAREFEDDIHEGPSLKTGQLPYYAQSVRQRYRNDTNVLRQAGYGRW